MTENQKMSISTLTELLEKLENLPHDEKHVTRTFLEVTEYERNERMFDKILLFYFNDEEQHGMNGLFIKSLFDAIYDENTIPMEKIISISPQFRTINGRIDILIETHSYFIIIENKIDAPLNNDLSGYYNDVEKINNDIHNNAKKIILVLLSLTREALDNSDVLSLASLIKNKENAEYRNITYSTFIDKIQNNIGEFISTADAEWLIFLKNFICTLRNLDGSSINMNYQDNRERLIFFSENKASINEILDQHRSLVKFFEDEVKMVTNAIGYPLSKLDVTYSSADNRLKDTWASARYTIESNKDSEEKVDKWLEIFRCLDGWEISLFASHVPKARDIRNWLDTKGFVIENKSFEGYFDRPKYTVPLKLWKEADIESNEVYKEVANKAIELFSDLISLLNS